MIRLNKLTDYAVLMLTRMGENPNEVFTAPQLALDSGVPQPTVAKLMKQLSRAGIVNSQRGVNGGYFLSSQPDGISVAQVIEALEGPISITGCVDGADTSCDALSLCPMSGHWNAVNRAIQDALAGVTLADMTAAPMSFLTANEAELN
jgi:FeS assembly SUF system regulator